MRAAARATSLPTRGKLALTAFPARTGRADLFGDTQGAEWDAFLRNFDLPRLPHADTSALSFGLGKRLSGVPMHTHGAVYADLMHGRKRWFLYPPGTRFEFDPNASQLQWLNNVYPRLPERLAPLECTCRPGETLYIPSQWWHATLNLDAWTVFMSSFILEPAPPAAGAGVAGLAGVGGAAWTRRGAR